MLHQPERIGKILGLHQPLFVADADISMKEIEKLRSIYGVASISENGMSEWPDEKVLRFARLQNCVLITCDRDFGRLVFKSRKACRGVIYLRRQPGNVADRVVWYVEVCRRRGIDFQERFATLDRERLRVRPLPILAAPSRIATLDQRKPEQVSKATRITIPERLWYLE
jgi:predicted nuclease of predicted toxin-antitoxin system